MPGRYDVRIVASARKSLLGVPEPHRARVQAAIRGLAIEPRPRGVVQLQGGGTTPTWRIRVGDYRVVYEIQDEHLVVLVIRVGHRGHVYRMR